MGLEGPLKGKWNAIIRCLKPYGFALIQLEFENEAEGLSKYHMVYDFKDKSKEVESKADDVLALLEDCFVHLYFVIDPKEPSKIPVGQLNNWRVVAKLYASENQNQEEGQ
jgi:hypothetical protein